MNRRQFIAAAAAAAALRLPGSSSAEDARPVFPQRGYYLCFMRMPTFGLPVWRKILSGAAVDGANVIILWMAGAFRSKKFPITWQWAKEHENVRHDFGRELLAHAHREGLKVLLGFTPFGYDGVNQLPLERPELKASATVVVYPHYFSGAKLHFALCEANAAKQPFDRRWTLFFTPHSAPLEPGLISGAQGAWSWNEAPSRFDVAGIRAGVKRARDAGCTGYVPSLECYSYVTAKPEAGEPWLVGKRQIPFGFGWLKQGDNPYGELPVRAIRLVWRELTTNPDLSDDELRARLGFHLFGANWQTAQVDDLFELFGVLNTERDWSVPGALTAPGLVADRARRGRLEDKKRALLREQLGRVQAMARRYQRESHGGASELHRIAQWLTDQWTGDNLKLLERP